MQNFHELFKAAFEKSNLNIRQLSIQTGISRQTIYNWLKGERQPTVRNYEKIIKFLNINEDSILR